jgi:hypothetical protein
LIPNRNFTCQQLFALPSAQRKNEDEQKILELKMNKQEEQKRLELGRSKKNREIKRLDATRPEQMFWKNSHQNSN